MLAVDCWMHPLGRQSHQQSVRLASQLELQERLAGQIELFGQLERLADQIELFGQLERLAGQLELLDVRSKRVPSRAVEGFRAGRRLEDVAVRPTSVSSDADEAIRVAAVYWIVPL
jgi:hypothetical protein